MGQPETERPGIKMNEMATRTEASPRRTVSGPSREPRKRRGWQGLSTRARLAIAGGVAFGALALGGAAAYKTVEPIRQGIDRIVPGLGNGEVPETFDNSADKGARGPNNIITLPQAEIDKLFPNAFGKLKEDGNNTILTLRHAIPEEERTKQEKAGVIIPDVKLEVREDKGTLQIQDPLDLSQSSDPNAVIKFTKSFGGLPVQSPDLEQSLQEQGFYNKLTFYDVPKGTIIKAPIDGFLTISRTDGQKRDPENATGGFIDLQGSDGTIRRLGIFGSKGGPMISDIFVLKPLLDAPDLDSLKEEQPVGSYGTQGKKGQQLFQTTTRLDQLEIVVLRASKGEVGKPFNHNNPLVATNLELFTFDGKMIASTN